MAATAGNHKPPTSHERSSSKGRTLIFEDTTYGQKQEKSANDVANDVANGDVAMHLSSGDSPNRPNSISPSQASATGALMLQKQMMQTTSVFNKTRDANVLGDTQSRISGGTTLSPNGPPSNVVQIQRIKLVPVAEASRRAQENLFLNT